MQPTNRLQREGRREGQNLTLKGVTEEDVEGEGLGVHGAAAAAVAVCISPLERRGIRACARLFVWTTDGTWKGEALCGSVKTRALPCSTLLFLPFPNFTYQSSRF
jgi:hypothetical protein